MFLYRSCDMRIVSPRVSQPRSPSFVSPLSRHFDLSAPGLILLTFPICYARLFNALPPPPCSVSTLASVIFFGLIPGPLFILGAGLVISSTIIYAVDKE